MGIIQNITDDQTAIAAAQAAKDANDAARAQAAAADQGAIDAANSKLVADQAQLDSLAPVQAALAEISTFVAGLTDQVEAAALTTLVASANAALGL